MTSCLHVEVTSCPGARDILPSHCALPQLESDSAFFKKLSFCGSVLSLQSAHHCTDFPSLKTQEAPIMCCKGQIPAEASRVSRVSRGISRRIVPREANVESGLSLQTRHAFLQQVIPQYCQATTVKKKSKLLDATTRIDRIQSQICHMAPQPCASGAIQTTVHPATPLRTRSPTRLVPGLERRQPDLCETPHALSPHAGRSGLRGLSIFT